MSWRVAGRIIGPAPGFRRREAGALCNVGQSGYGWASAGSGSNARCLGFNFSGLDPQGSSYRVDALQVRCLQE